MQARIIDHKHIQWQSFCNLWCTTESEHMKGQCFCNLWCTTESECVFREQSPCHCAASVQKQPTHHSPSHRQSACVHVCRSNLPITAITQGKVHVCMCAWVHVCMCAEATYPSRPITQAECKNTWRQSAKTHKAECKNTRRQSAKTHKGTVQEHMKAECKNTRRQSARTHGGRVQEHMEAECKNTQRKPRRQRKSQRGGLRCQHSLNFHCCYTTMQQKPLPT